MGVRTTSTFDVTNRVIGLSYSDGSAAVSYSFDAAGNRTQMIDGSGTVTYSYDNRNRLTNVNRGPDTFTYGYDKASNIISRTYPDSTVVQSTYDDDGRLSSTATTGATTTYGYDAASNLLTATLPASNGYVESRTYDQAGRTTDIRSVKGGATLSDYAYSYDNVGNPTTVTTPSEVATFGYDPQDRVTNACYGTACAGGSISWAYDAVGNRTAETRPSGTTTYTYNSGDELTSAAGPAGTIPYSYDTDGRMITAGLQSYGWNGTGKMTTATTAPGTTTYTYDGDGNRLSASLSGATTNYSWDLNTSVPNLALERDGSGGLVRRYVYGAGPVSMTTAAGSFYYHDDALGSTVAMTSSTGATETTATYEPFGATRATTKVDPAAPANPLAFNGQYLDPTNLYHLRARQYDPTLGRFISPDPAPPAVADPSTSTYLYAFGRPGVLVDPSGLFPSWKSVKLVASFVPIVGSAIAAYDFGASLANVALTCGIHNWGASACTDAWVTSAAKGVSLALSVASDLCEFGSAGALTPACAGLKIASLGVGVLSGALDYGAGTAYAPGSSGYGYEYGGGGGGGWGYGPRK
jgi:RHS repeat-associated protein